MRWSTTELLALKPNLVISASVFSNYKDARDFRFQDWVAWNKEGILDATVPMDFSPDNQRIFNPRADFAMTNQWNRTIWIGQAAYMNPVENTLKQLQFCRDKGFRGTLFYCYRKPGPDVAITLEHDEQPDEENNGWITINSKQAKAAGNWRDGTVHLFNEQGGKGDHASYFPKIKTNGDYSVYEWHIAEQGRATNVAYSIIHAKGTNTFRVNQEENGSEWNFLGTFHFDTNSLAEIRIDGECATKGNVVVADSIRIIPGNSTNPRATSIRTGKLDSRIARQEKIFKNIKESHQPNWVAVHDMKWKQATGILGGSVQTLMGEPVYNAIVRMKSLGEEQKTEPHGAFAFFDLSPGDYAVEIFTPKGGKQEQKVSIKAGKVTKITVRLKE